MCNYTSRKKPRTIQHPAFHALSNQTDYENTTLSEELVLKTTFDTFLFVRCTINPKNVNNGCKKCSEEKG